MFFQRTRIHCRKSSICWKYRHFVLDYLNIYSNSSIFEVWKNFVRTKRGQGDSLYLFKAQQLHSVEIRRNVYGPGAPMWPMMGRKGEGKIRLKQEEERMSLLDAASCCLAGRWLGGARYSSLSTHLEIWFFFLMWKLLISNVNDNSFLKEHHVKWKKTL